MFVWCWFCYLPVCYWANNMAARECTCSVYCMRGLTLWALCPLFWHIRIQELKMLAFDWSLIWCMDSKTVTWILLNLKFLTVKLENGNVVFFLKKEQQHNKKKLKENLYSPSVCDLTTRKEEIFFFWKQWVETTNYPPSAFYWLSLQEQQWSI